MKKKLIAKVYNSGWLIVAMLAFSTFLNYIDRQTLSLLSRPIQDALNMDDRAYGMVVTCFMIAYTIGNLSSGMLIDRLGAESAMPCFVVLWSVAGALGAFAEHSTHLGISRFLLGLFETGNFLAAPIIVARFLPYDQKALGIGLYTAAAMLGAAISPPLVTYIHQIAGWRMAFLLLGAAGLIWAWLWCLLPFKGSRTAVEGGDVTADAIGSIDITTWSQALREPRIWAQSLWTMLTYPVWFFYLNWFPKYLTDERSLSTLEMGQRAWIVYLFAGIGCLLAGGVIALLKKRTRLGSLQIRIVTMLVVALLAPIGAINFFTPPLAISLASAAWVALIHMIWQTTITSLPLELFSARSLGKVFGIVGIVSGIGAIVSTWLIGTLVGSISYKPMFLVMAAVYLLAVLIMLGLYKRAGIEILCISKLNNMYKRRFFSKS